MAKVITALRSIAQKGVSAEKVALITGGSSGIGAAFVSLKTSTRAIPMMAAASRPALFPQR